MAGGTTPIDPTRFAAGLFDMDGVLTDTAGTHTRAWTETFDELLQHLADTGTGPAFAPFTNDDYTRFVDGVPRYDGVRRFLASRGITLPDGDKTDPPGLGTVCAVGNAKNDRFLAIVAAEGAAAYPGSVQLVHWFKDQGMKVAVVTSSVNGPQILAAAGIADLFDARIDGTVIESGHLPGKPAPDTYLAAAAAVGAEAATSIVFEDALSGVEAGRAGSFGLVVGVNRKGDAQALHDHGADVVVDDLADLLP